MELIKLGKDGNADLVITTGEAEVVDSVTGKVVAHTNLVTEMPDDDSMIIDEHMSDYVEGADGLISDAVDNLIDVTQGATKDYAKFLQGGFRPVEYQQIIKTDSLTVNGEYTELYGLNSPLKYNRIHRLPLYGYNPQRQVDDSTNDITHGYEGEGYIPPDVLVPNIGDLFIGPVGDQKVIFKIGNVEGSRGVEKVWKISFSSYRSATQGELNNLALSIQRGYYCRVENIGTSKAVIISSVNAQLASSINDLKRKFVDYYLESSFADKLNTIITSKVYDEFKYDIYDSFLMYFIAEGDIFENSDYKSLILTKYDFSNFGDFEFKSLYRKSLYNAFTTGSLQYLKYPFVKLQPLLRTPANIGFSGYSPMMHVSSLITEAEAEEMTANGLFKTKCILPYSLLNKMKDGAEYSVAELQLMGPILDPTRNLFKLIIDYYTHVRVEATDVSYRPFLDTDRLETLLRIEYELMDMDTFMNILPFVLYILTLEERLIWDNPIG